VIQTPIFGVSAQSTHTRRAYVLGVAVDHRREPSAAMALVRVTPRWIEVVSPRKPATIDPSSCLLPLPLVGEAPWPTGTLRQPIEVGAGSIPIDLENRPFLLPCVAVRIDLQ